MRNYEYALTSSLPDPILRQLSGGHGRGLRQRNHEQTIDRALHVVRIPIDDELLTLIRSEYPIQAVHLRLASLLPIPSLHDHPPLWSQHR